MNLIDIIEKHTYKNLIDRIIKLKTNMKEQDREQEFEQALKKDIFCIQSNTLVGVKEEYERFDIWMVCNNLKLIKKYFRDFFDLDLVELLKKINKDLSETELDIKYFDNDLKFKYDCVTLLADDEERHDQLTPYLWELIDFEYNRLIQERKDRKRKALNRYNHSRKLKRRNFNGLTTREQQKQDTYSKIQELKEKGLKQIEVSKELGVNKSTVSRYWR